MKRVIFAASLAVACGHAPTLAAEEHGPAISFALVSTAGATLLYEEDCPHCQQVSIRCDASQTLWLEVFGFDRIELAAWFLHDELRHDDTYVRDIKIVTVIDLEEEAFGVWELGRADISGEWNAISWVSGSQALDWLRSFGKGDAAAVVTPDRRIDLLATDQHRENRTAFVEACLAL